MQVTQEKARQLQQSLEDMPSHATLVSTSLFIGNKVLTQFHIRGEENLG